MYADGQRVAIVGGWHGLDRNPYCEDNLRRAKEAGMILGSYTALNSMSGVQSVQHMKDACGSMWRHVKIVGIDCEIDGITKGIIREALIETRRLGKKTCIYTAYWWWHDHFGYPDDFKNERLWNAFYDGDPDRDFSTLPYGGWPERKLVIEQWSGSQDYMGTVVDRNSIKRSFVEDRMVSEPTPPDDEQKANADRILQATAVRVRQGLEPMPATLQGLKYLVALWE